MRTPNSVLFWLTLAMLFTTGVSRAASNAPSISIVPITLAATNSGPTAPNAMAVDPQGNIYLAGIAYPPFPTTPGAAQTQPGGGTCYINGAIFLLPVLCPDAFVAKVELSGNAVNIIWATLLGGPGSDSTSAVTLDAAGNVYIAGTTDGQFPTTAHSFMPAMPAGAGGLFVAELNPQGSQVIYSTYLPEVPLPGLAQVTGIAADSAGNAYIAGYTEGDTGYSQAFVAKLNANGSARLYNTVLGGSNGAYIGAIAIDPNGNAYITGSTSSPDFPVTSGAFQSKLNGSTNAFVAKLDPVGNVVYATFLGGSASDGASAIQIDAQGYAYVAGATSSPDFPTTAGAWEPAPVIPEWNPIPPIEAGFAAKLSPDGTALAYSSFVFADSIGVSAMALDEAGGAYLLGTTLDGIAVTPSAPQPCTVQGTNLFVVHLNESGALLDRTYAGAETYTYTNFGFFEQPPLALAFEGGQLYFLTQGSQQNLGQLQFGGPGYVPAPCISQNVVNAATFLFSGLQVAPGEFVSLTGIGIGPETGVANQLSADGTISTELAGVRVIFNGQPAPLLYVQSQQINAIVPFEAADNATTAVQVQYQGTSTNYVYANVAAYAPGLFHLADGSAAVNQDGTLNGPNNPAKVGSIISLYGTGFGQTQPAGVTGSLFPLEPAMLVPAALMPLEVFIGGVAATIEYAGAAPGQIAGIDQLNVVVPTQMPQSGAAVTVGTNYDYVSLIIYVKP